MRALVPAAAAASLDLLAAILYAAGYHQQYVALLEHWGAAPFRTPFLDMHGVTSAVQCHRQGFDVYVDNPCDVFQRVHAYSPLWLWLAVLPITTSWDNPLGLVVVLLFVATLPFLPAGHGWRDTMVITLATISSTTMFALERANVDLLMFVMAVLAVVLTERAWLRTSGYAVALLAGMLKFYPVVLLLLALRERFALCMTIALVALGVILAWFVLDANDILRAIANIPTNPPFDGNVFGAHNLPFGLVAFAGWPGSIAVTLQMLLMVAVLIIALATARRIHLDALTQAEADFLLVGCALMVSCFAITQNVTYRAIYLLFVLPGLLALGPRWRAVVWLIVLLMWNHGLRLAIYDIAGWLGIPAAPNGVLRLSIWLLRELAWWLVVTLLLAVLLRLVWESRTFSPLRSRLTSPRHAAADPEYRGSRRPAD